MSIKEQTIAHSLSPEDGTKNYLTHSSRHLWVHISETTGDPTGSFESEQYTFKRRSTSSFYPQIYGNHLAIDFYLKRFFFAKILKLYSRLVSKRQSTLI